LYGLLLRTVPVNEVFAGPAENNLSRNGDGRIFFEPDWRFRGVPIVENDCHARFGNAGLTALVDEILEILRSNRAHIRDTEDETDGVENVGFTTAV
jgi:hypothetical protein